MDIVMGVVNFVKDHSVELFAAVGALYSFLLIVVKLTPTPKDDEMLSNIASFVLKVSGFFGVKK